MPAKIAPERESHVSEGSGIQQVPSGGTRISHAETVDFRQVWKEHHDSPNFENAFFKDVQFAHDGGFSEVQLLFSMDRFVWALFQLSCVALNLAALSQRNFSAVFNNPEGYIVDSSAMSRHLIINNLIGRFEGDRRMSPIVVLAFLELGMTVFLFGWLLRLCWVVLRGDKIRKWRAVSVILWNVVPELSSFSALRILSKVTPKVMKPEIKRVMRLFTEAPGMKRGLRLAFFVVSRVVCGFVGAEAFMTKFVIVAQDYQETLSSWYAFYVAAAFLNQLLGVVDVNKFSQRRLFLFIFGGEDSFMTPYEKEVAKTWEGILAKTIWEESQKRQFSVAWFFAITLSYGDTDFQRLTLNDSIDDDRRQPDTSTAEDATWARPECRQKVATEGV